MKVLLNYYLSEIMKKGSVEKRFYPRRCENDNLIEIINYDNKISLSLWETRELYNTLRSIIEDHSEFFLKYDEEVKEKYNNEQ